MGSRKQVYYLLLGFMGGETGFLLEIAIGAMSGLIISKALIYLLPKRGIQSEDPSNYKLPEEFALILI